MKKRTSDERAWRGGKERQNKKRGEKDAWALASLLAPVFTLFFGLWAFSFLSVYSSMCLCLCVFAPAAVKGSILIGERGRGERTNGATHQRYPHMYFGKEREAHNTRKGMRRTPRKKERGERERDYFVFNVSRHLPVNLLYFYHEGCQLCHSCHFFGSFLSNPQSTLSLSLSLCLLKPLCPQCVQFSVFSLAWARKNKVSSRKVRRGEDEVRERKGEGHITFSWTLNSSENCKSKKANVKVKGKLWFRSWKVLFTIHDWFWCLCMSYTKKRRKRRRRGRNNSHEYRQWERNRSLLSMQRPGEERRRERRRRGGTRKRGRVRKKKVER